MKMATMSVSWFMKGTFARLICIVYCLISVLMFVFVMHVKRHAADACHINTQQTHFSCHVHHANLQQAPSFCGANKATFCMKSRCVRGDDCARRILTDQCSTRSVAVCSIYESNKLNRFCLRTKALTGASWHAIIANTYICKPSTHIFCVHSKLV